MKSKRLCLQHWPNDPWTWIFCRNCDIMSITLDIQEKLPSNASTQTVDYITPVTFYTEPACTFLQRKFTLISSSSPGDLGSATLPGSFWVCQMVLRVICKRPHSKIPSKMTCGRDEWPRAFGKLRWFSCAKYSEKSVFNNITYFIRTKVNHYQWELIFEGSWTK